MGAEHRQRAVIEAVLPNGRYRVRLEGGRSVLAHLGGRARTDLVRLLPGDAVTVELAGLDPGRARIVGGARPPAG